MKIVHLLWTLDVGGAETMLVDIVNEQVKQAKVTIIVINELVNRVLANKIDTRCDVVLLRRKIGSRDIWPWIRLNWCLLNKRPDIIHFHLEGMRKMVFYPATKVYTIHNTHSSGKEYQHYDALYAISDAVRSYTLTQGYNSTIIYNGIHPEKVKCRCRNHDGCCRIVCVGRLFTPHKGQDILIKAIEVLKEKGINRFHLDLIGEGVSRDALETLVSEKCLNDFISFKGHRDRNYIYEHLCDYDLFVLPSRSEGFGLSVAEAISAKISVLVSDLDGPLEIIDKGRLGLVFQSENIQDLANKIELFIKNGSNETIIEKAYQYVCTNFDIKMTVKNYFDEYKKLL